MEFLSTNGNRFALNVERYEYPDEPLGPCEDNPAGEDFERARFLVVALSFEMGKKIWQRSIPLMTTEELGRFARWLESIRRKKAESMGICFTERCLEISVDSDSTAITIHITDECLPDEPIGGGRLELEFPTAEVDLTSAVESLQQQVRRYPGRP